MSSSSRRTIAGALALLGAVACKGPASTPASTPPTPQPPSIVSAAPGASTDDIWGVADLHAHPASHLAFGGLDDQAGLIWGAQALPGGGMTAIPGGDLPDIPSCDPETHDSHVTDEVSRATRAKVFGLLTEQTNFPHTAHGFAKAGETPYESWPNARDVLHQQMNVQSIRRAYEGGLRLIFAATVESQLIGLAMHTTIFPSPFAPSRQVERESAEQQLIYIRKLVSANADWMEIAATPEQAEAAIRANRLAVVLALEMDGLLLDDVKDLVSLYGVASIIPIHLVDNDVGGTAAYSDVFNGGTALLGAMFGYPGRYISVESDPSFAFHFSWPIELAIQGPSFNVQQVDYATAAALGYSAYPLCNPVGVGIPGQLGTRNSVGLREPQTISELMKMGLLIDVAHMGFRSTGETIDLALSTCSYPLIDTHTAVHYRDQAGTGSERDLYEDHADYVAAHQGVIGLGSTGRVTRTACSEQAIGIDTMESARGGPLVSLSGREEGAVVSFPPGGRACAPAFAPGSALEIHVTAQGPHDSAIPYVQIGYDSGRQQLQPIALNDPASPLSTVALQEPAPNINAVSVGLLFPSTCDYKNGTNVDVTLVEIAGASGTPLTIGRAQLGSRAGSSQVVATLSCRTARHSWSTRDAPRKTPANATLPTSTWRRRPNRSSTFASGCGRARAGSGTSRASS